MFRQLRTAVVLSCSLALALAASAAAAGPIEFLDIPGAPQLTRDLIPEPASLLLFGGALTAVAARMRRTRRAPSRG